MIVLVTSVEEIISLCISFFLLKLCTTYNLSKKIDKILTMTVVCYIIYVENKKRRKELLQ